MGTPRRDEIVMTVSDNCMPFNTAEWLSDGQFVTLNCEQRGIAITLCAYMWREPAYCLSPDIYAKLAPLMFMTLEQLSKHVADIQQQSTGLFYTTSDNFLHCRYVDRELQRLKGNARKARAAVQKKLVKPECTNIAAGAFENKKALRPDSPATVENLLQLWNKMMPQYGFLKVYQVTPKRIGMLEAIISHKPEARILEYWGRVYNAMAQSDFLRSGETWCDFDFPLKNIEHLEKLEKGRYDN